MSRIVDLTVTIGPETFSPPSVNKRLTLTSSYRGPGYWRASTVEMVLHTGEEFEKEDAAKESKRMRQVDKARWEFEIGGTGFEATLGLTFKIVPERV